MSNSSLVKYTKVSPNKTSPRDHTIDTITIHCVVGQASVESLGNRFQITEPASRRASANYGIGSDGRVGMYVEEKDRSWCSSNADNDNRAITIECASDSKYPYAINDAVYKTLIELCADICKRNNIKELKWKADKSLIGQVDKQNMTVHRWFARKSCPGQYIYERLGQIAEEVNKKLKASEVTVLYRVQTGAFLNKSYADTMLAKVKAAGFSTYMVQTGKMYRVQVGAYKVRANAEKMAKRLKAAGFNTYITTVSGTPVAASAKKSIDEIAREIVLGKWGNGSDRKNRLIKAGYTQDEIVQIQKKVNELL